MSSFAEPRARSGFGICTSSNPAGCPFLDQRRNDTHQLLPDHLAMSERRSKVASHNAPVVIAITITTALLLYPLSMGPAVWLREHTSLGRSPTAFLVYGYAYAPLVSIIDRFP